MILRNLLRYQDCQPAFLDYPEMMGGNVSYDSGFLIFDEEEKINALHC